jgi:hypothetical protein
MVFSSPIFLFLFLPAVLLCCLFRSLPLRNLWLLLFRVRFHDWDEALLAKEKPDIVIDETVERKFNTLSPKDLMPRSSSQTIAAAAQTK